MENLPHYYTYLIQCADGTFYCGYTTNLERRLREHNSKAGRGAKYTRPRQPVRLQYFEEFTAKGDALKREHQIKQLSHAEKNQLIRAK